MSEQTLLALTVAMMAGALLGWLAPALVSLAIIAAVTLGYYVPACCDWRHRFDDYDGTAVAVMQRCW